jgi:spermidine synthase
MKIATHQEISQVPASRLSMPYFAQLVGFLFFFSGLSSLIYQILWMRHLSLFFGSDVYSAAITLSCFMAGLCIGSWLASKMVGRLRSPLIWYGIFEIAIGIYAFLFQELLNLFLAPKQFLYLHIYDNAFWGYNVFRLAAAGGLLLIPCSLMGATLPIIVQRFVTKDKELGQYTGYFYAINTLGAFCGVLGVGFILLPYLGMQTTTAIASAINVCVGILAMCAAGWSAKKVEEVEDNRLVAEERPEIPMQDFDSDGSMSLQAQGKLTLQRQRVGLIAIAVSGLAALALEVVWTRILVQSFSGTVYSFAIMLASFLFGIALGSHLASKTIDRYPHPMRRLARLEICLGLSVAVLGLLSYIVHFFFGNALWILAGISGARFALASVIATSLVSFGLIMIPTALMGATFPVAVKICTRSIHNAGAWTGRVYTANTAGAIVGALLAGFVFIPAVGSRGSLILVALIFLGNGLYLLAHCGSTLWNDRRLALFVGLVLLLLGAVSVLPQQTVANFNLQRTTRPEVVYHGEGVAHTIDIVRNEEKQTIMMVNGNIEADTTFTQRRHFILKAHLPLLLHRHPEDVAVIGLGLGITLAATERNAGVKHIDVIELTPEMVRAHNYLTDLTDSVLTSPKIRVLIDDGRNFMALTDQTFDVITADPIHPRISGVGYLYTKEYYESVRRALKPEAVVCQWMPMYHISKQSFDVAFRTFASVFPNSSFWYVRGHGLFIGTVGPFGIDYAGLQSRFQDPTIAGDLRSIAIHSPDELLSHLLMGPEAIRTYLDSLPDKTLNTDDNAYLEYHTPFELLETTDTIMELLLPAAGVDWMCLRNVSAEQRGRIRELWEKRNSRILPELKEKIN